MINTEKQVLATVIVFPETAPLFFNNLGENSFLGLDNRKVYETVKGLWKTGNSFDRYVLLDLLPDKSDFLTSLSGYVEGVSAKAAGSFLTERIRMIKGSRSKKILLSQIHEEANSPYPDFERIIETAESGRLVELSKEEGDFQVAFDEYMEWKDSDKTKISLGFPAFDHRTGNYHYGELLAVMGRTTAGKSFVGLNIINHLVSVSDDLIGLFSLEMVKAAVVERMMQLFFNVYWKELDEKREAKELYLEDFISRYKQRLKIYSRIYSVFEIANIIKRDRLQIVFIDYLQLMKKGSEGRSRYEKVTYLTEEIKEVAKNQDVFIVMMVQITREGEGGWEPVTIDMARESGAIEENSDFIVGCWQPSLKEGAEECWEGKLCMKLLKNKRGLTIGCEFSFDKDSRRIYEICEGISKPRKERKNGKPDWIKD